MDKELRILILEDVSPDAELAELELRKMMSRPAVEQGATLPIS